MSGFCDAGFRFVSIKRETSDASIRTALPQRTWASRRSRSQRRSVGIAIPSRVEACRNVRRIASGPTFSAGAILPSMRADRSLIAPTLSTLIYNVSVISVDIVVAI